MPVARWGIRALIVGVLALAPAAAHAADPADPGRTTAGTFASGGSQYRYLLYVPKSYRPRRKAPLVVMVHGCQTTAEQELKVTRFNRLAERKGFVVLYPDVDAIGRALPGPLNQCWKFFYPPTYFRGNSDGAAIAELTRATMRRLRIDAERVYLVGVSAGGLMTSADAATYPDLYAAVGIVESAGYADGLCFTTGAGIPATTSAALARVAMGSRARVVPLFVIGSTGDLAFPQTCAKKALEQGLRTNNLVLGASQTAPISLVPAVVSRGQRPGGRTYTVSSYRDPSGCLIGERWIIDGMPHAWPGGTTDPKLKGYVDNKSPDGADIAWRFLSRYTRSATAMPCAETRAPKAALTRASRA
jgi:poly(hydroxyalkanoate) depolymerase family esterase